MRERVNESVLKSACESARQSVRERLLLRVKTGRVGVCLCVCVCVCERLGVVVLKEQARARA